jgi:hypothetical protein
LKTELINQLRVKCFNLCEVLFISMVEQFYNPWPYQAQIFYFKHVTVEESESAVQLNTLLLCLAYSSNNSEHC